MADFDPVETYGSGYLLFTHLQAAIENLGGRVVVGVVQGKEGDGGHFVYALFYEDRHGRVFDVLQQRNAELKTFSRADTLSAALTRIGVDNEVIIPGLVEKNVLQKGALRFKDK